VRERGWRRWRRVVHQVMAAPLTGKWTSVIWPVPDADEGRRLVGRVRRRREPGGGPA